MLFRDKGGVTQVIRVTYDATKKGGKQTYLGSIPRYAARLSDLPERLLEQLVVDPSRQGRRGPIDERAEVQAWLDQRHAKAEISGLELTVRYAPQHLEDLARALSSMHQDVARHLTPELAGRIIEKAQEVIRIARRQLPKEPRPMRSAPVQATKAIRPTPAAGQTAEPLAARPAKRPVPARDQAPAPAQVSDDTPLPPPPPEPRANSRNHLLPAWKAYRDQLIRDGRFGAIRIAEACGITREAVRKRRLELEQGDAAAAPDPNLFP